MCSLYVFVGPIFQTSPCCSLQCICLFYFLDIAVYSPGQVNAGENIYEYIIPTDYISVTRDEKPQASPKSPIPNPPNVKANVKSSSKFNYSTLVPQPSIKNTYVSLGKMPSERPLPEPPSDVLRVQISPKIPTQPKASREEPVPSTPISAVSPKPTSPVSPSPISPATPTAPKAAPETPSQKYRAAPRGIKVLPFPESATDKAAKNRVTDSASVSDKRRNSRGNYTNSNRATDIGFQAQPPTGSQKYRTASLAKDGSKIEIRNVADIPRDISCLTVEELCDCLKLLNLNNYVDSFRNLNVDGNLLLDFTVDDLRNDPNFRMSVTEAKMVVRFARNGWRPKHS